ncbi:MAG: alpha/beta fold hydrolase, partial [Miltoncostaeaceae bacterium]
MRHPIVLLHPFPLDAGFWNPVAARLAAERAVHAPEFPGFGGAPAESNVSIARVADAVATRIARQTTTGRAVVCGVSMGGYVALALAARHPMRVAGLILVATRPDRDAEEVRRGRIEAATSIEMGMADTFLDEMIPRLAPADATDTLALVRTMARRQDPTAIATALQAMADRDDRRGQLGGMDMPALVIHGEDDVPIPVGAAESMAGALRDARLVVMRRTGHLPPLQRPDEFLQHVRPLLSRVDD